MANETTLEANAEQQRIALAQTRQRVEDALNTIETAIKEYVTLRDEPVCQNALSQLRFELGERGATAHRPRTNTPACRGRAQYHRDGDQGIRDTAGRAGVPERPLAAAIRTRVHEAPSMTTVDAKAQALAEALQQFTGRPLRDGDSLGAGTHSVGPTVGEVRMLLADLPEEWNSAPFRICHTAQYAEDISSDGLAQEISACWSGKIEGGKPVMERCIRVTGE